MVKIPVILLIDDDVDFIEVTKTVLESRPYRVEVAHEGNEGIRKAQEVKPDLILLDIIMPLKDGFTAAQQIKQDPQLRNIPVVMLTSFSEKGPGSGLAVGSGMTLDAEDYIEKPVKPEELLKRINRILESQ